MNESPSVEAERMEVEEMIPVCRCAHVLVFRGGDFEEGGFLKMLPVV